MHRENHAMGQCGMREERASLSREVAPVHRSQKVELLKDLRQRRV